jgi:ABC-2 type transport system ATP-binding protein
MLDRVPEPTLILDGLTKRYGDILAVRGVSCTARAGTITGVLGPNGAGKTTTIRMILGILPPDAGTIRILGSPAAQAVRRHLGYLPEERGLYARTRALDMLVHIGQLNGMTGAAARRSGQDWLERLGLGSRARDLLESFSKGMAQRVQFACAVVHDPQLIILDEPLSGLDPIAADELRDILLDLAHGQGRTVLLSTHDLVVAERMCEDIVLIHQGQVVLDGSLAVLKRLHARSSAALIFEGDASFLAEHPAVRSVTLYGNFADLELAPEASTRQLLHDCADRLNVLRFELVEPTLAEIFRRQVQRASS